MGRRKKHGERYPCGKLKPEKFPPILVRQMVDAGRKKIIDAAFGTSIGQLRLEEKLTDTQVSAATHFARFMGHYDRLFGGVSRTAKSPDYQLGRAGQGGHFEDVVEPEELIRAMKAASEDYDAILAKLTNSQWSAVYHTVLLDEACPWPRRPDLVAGLNILALFFGYARHMPGVSVVEHRAVA